MNYTICSKKYHFLNTNPFFTLYSGSGTIRVLLPTHSIPKDDTGLNEVNVNKKAGRFRKIEKMRNRMYK